MNPLTEQDVVNIVKRFNTQQGGTYGGFSVPRHVHNGSDMDRILMANLMYDARGLNFPVTNGQISVQVTNSFTTPETNNDLTIIPPFVNVGIDLHTNLNLGQFPNYFYNINLFARNQVSFTVGHDYLLTQLNTEYQWNDNNLTIASTAPLTNDAWFMRFTVNNFADLPATPQLGDWTYASSDGGLTGQFYACESPGVWTPK